MGPIKRTHTRTDTLRSTNQCSEFSRRGAFLQQRSEKACFMEEVASDLGHRVYGELQQYECGYG